MAGDYCNIQGDLCVFLNGDIAGIFKKKITMRKTLISTLAVLCCVACSKNDVPGEEPTEVVLTFCPYEVEPMTRATVSDFATRLDVWLYEGGDELQAIHQQGTDEEFGSLAVTLNKNHTYTVYAVAHKGADVATLTGGIVSFPDDKTTHSFFYSETFTPATKSQLSCIMHRIVGQFRLEITDDAPSSFKGLRIEIPQVPCRYNVVNGACNPADRSTTLSWAGSASSFSFFLLAADDAPTLYDITVTALDSDGNPIQQRTFEDVGIQNDYRTTYRGAFFTDAALTATFSAQNIQDFDTVNF